MTCFCRTNECLMFLKYLNFSHAIFYWLYHLIHDLNVVLYLLGCRFWFGGSDSLDIISLLCNLKSWNCFLKSENRSLVLGKNVQQLSKCESGANILFCGLYILLSQGHRGALPSWLYVCFCTEVIPFGNAVLFQ